MRLRTTRDEGPRFHLVPVEDDWGVRREGGRAYECIYEDRHAALREAKRLAHARRGLLVIHDHDGRAGDALDYRPLPEPVTAELSRAGDT